jgi:hypothetical protein
VVLDAGIATAENVAWLSEHGYRYVVVSRKRRRRFDPAQATLIKEADGVRIQAQRIVNAETGEVDRSVAVLGVGVQSVQKVPVGRPNKINKISC